jgi:hypothetical protein
LDVIRPDSRVIPGTAKIERTGYNDLTTGRDQRLVVAAHNLIRFNELKKVLQIFKETGVPVIVLKGAALANTVYDSIGNRPMSDVDLLIHPQDRLRIIPILENRGYQISAWPQRKFHPYNISVTSEIDFIASNGTVFDLHWELISFEWVRLMTRIDMQGFWKSAQPLNINGLQVLQLSPCDSLIHICLHLMMQAYAHKIAYQDITTLLNYYQPFPWDNFLTRTIDSRTCTTCYFALDAAASVLGAAVPDYVMDRLKPSFWKKWLMPQISDPIKGLRGVNQSDDRRYLVQLVAADRLIDVARVLLWLFFPGPAWLAERYDLDNGLQTFLACFWHPCVILSRGFRGVFQTLVKSNQSGSS